LTALRTDAEFFARHTLSELRGWSDYALEQHGRLTRPLRYDAQIDQYAPTTWDEAYAAIGAQLKQLAPDAVAFFASGRASLEASFMYQLFARAYPSMVRRLILTATV
jgi:anaerobic selenocysteine-containing dehydrogenase